MPQGAFPIGLRKQKKGIPTQPVRGRYKIGVVINVFTSMDDVGGRHINEAVGVVVLVMGGRLLRMRARVVALLDHIRPWSVTLLVRLRVVVMNVRRCVASALSISPVVERWRRCRRSTRRRRRWRLTDVVRRAL
jgi:hypothetical protein